MTTTNTDAELIEEEDETGVNKMPLIVQKVSKFGNQFQGGSKFGKWPAGGSNPQLKQRPGRAAARGR